MKTFSHPIHLTILILFTSLLSLVTPSTSLADDISTSTSGRLNLRGVYALDEDSAKEQPSFEGRVKFDASTSLWRFHSWVEGGWDGSVKRPADDHSLVKSANEVYQSNTPLLEFKELYLAYTPGDLEVRAGIQRYSWGRLDEYPVNDLLNPWDYTQFLRKTLEDRKIGVASMSATLTKGDWSWQAVWVPVNTTYRLALPNERWSGASVFSSIGAEVTAEEPAHPSRSFKNGNFGLRMLNLGDIEWAVSLYHGYDPSPVFKTTSLKIAQIGTSLVIDPGFTPDYHRITSFGTDMAFVRGDWSLRVEAAYKWNRLFNIKDELWGYPSTVALGTYQLNKIERTHDTIDYGIGADYRPFEDGLITLQAQQTVILDRTDELFDRKVETILWLNLKTTWMNQKIETNLALAYNPEHGAVMDKANAFYTINDSWKTGVTAILLNGPTQSIFGRYGQNDQIEAELIFSW